MKESMDIFEERLQVVKGLVERTNKQSVLIIQQHPGEEDDYLQFPPVRESISNIIAFAEVSNPKQAEDIMRFSLSRVDRYILDIDQKRKNTSDIIEAVNNYPINSKLLYYSDFDVWGSAAVDFITEIEGSLQGKKVLVYGHNCLTARVIRKLLSFGAVVFLNKIEVQFPFDKYSFIQFSTERLKDSEFYKGDYDIIIGSEILTTAEGVNPAIHAASVYDIGLGNFTKDYINSCYEYGSKVYRFDNRAGISGVVLGLMETDYLLNNNMGSVQIGNIRVVSGGILSEENAIIVDNAFSPSFVFGVADGRGMFKRELSQTNLDDLSIIKSLIEKNDSNI